MPKTKHLSPFAVLRLTLDVFKPENQQIFYPYIFTVFINLLVLDFLYFVPRFPLVDFFGVIIKRVWGEQYLHYPLDLLLLPKLFYFAQTFIFLFIGNILMVMVADMVATVNNDKKVHFRSSFKKTLSSYPYIFLYSVLLLALFSLFDKGYGLLIARALKIHSSTGIFFMIKKAVFNGAGYAQFIYGILVTAVLAYLPVVVVLEKKKFLGALIANFKVLFGSFWFTLVLVMIPTLFYFPLMLLRDNISPLIQWTEPEIQVVVIALSVFVTAAIDIFVMAAVTTYYLYKKETS